jgi:hypothetical protein
MPMEAEDDEMVIDQPQTKDRNEPVRKKSFPAPPTNDGDDSWRPREPVTNSMPVEVEDDEIIDPPSPAPAHTSSFNKRRKASRRLSRIASHALSLVASRPSSPQQDLLVLNSHNSQGSIELGDTQRLLHRSPRSHIPESQFDQAQPEPEEDQEDDETPTSQMTFVPESSLGYFERASQDLQQPFRKPNLVRSKSMSASMHTPRRSEAREAGMMVGGINMTATFQHTLSPVRSSGAMPTLMSSTGKEKSLKSLTRQASIELGTLPSRRKKLVSLPFQPPFKK